jgi:hypothetical protein
MGKCKDVRTERKGKEKRVTRVEESILCDDRIDHSRIESGILVKEIR